MKDIRILFMGTPDFAVGILKALLTADKKVIGVVTAPDRPAGRGQKLKSSAVKRFAEHHQLEVLQPPNLKADSFQVTLQRLQPTLIIVVAFRMLPKKVWDFPHYGTFNLHASLLPQYRGAAPINWSIINGEEKTGVSTFFIDEEIDTGSLLLQDEVSILPNDNAGILHDKLMEAGATIVLKTVDGIAQGDIEPKAQPQLQSLKTAHKLNKQNTKIDWDQDGQKIHDLIRGLSPFPVAWCYFYNRGKKTTCKVRKAKFQQNKQNLEPGSVYQESKELKVAVKKGFIRIENLQLAGKRKMNASDFLNGYVLEKDAKMS